MGEGRGLIAQKPEESYEAIPFDATGVNLSTIRVRRDDGWRDSISIVDYRGCRTSIIPTALIRRRRQTPGRVAWILHRLRTDQVVVIPSTVEWKSTLKTGNLTSTNFEPEQFVFNIFVYSRDARVLFDRIVDFWIVQMISFFQLVGTGVFSREWRVLSKA